MAGSERKVLSLSRVDLPEWSLVCLREHSGTHIPDLKSPPPPTPTPQSRPSEDGTEPCVPRVLTLCPATIQIFRLRGHSHLPTPPCHAPECRLAHL